MSGWTGQKYVDVVALTPRLDELKEEALAFLRTIPSNNMSKCAKHIGVNRYEMQWIYSKFRDEFDAIESERLDSLEERVYQAALGDDPDGLPPGFTPSFALKILERRKMGWQSTTNTNITTMRLTEPEKPKVNIRAIEEHVTKLLEPPDEEDGVIDVEPEGISRGTSKWEEGDEE